MTISEAQIRAASLGVQQGRVFVYFRHTPSGVKFIVSRDLTEKGKAKHLIRSNDPGYAQATRFVDTLIRIAKSEGMGGRGGSVPTAAALAPHVPAASAASGVEATYLPAMGLFGARILLKA